MVHQEVQEIQELALWFIRSKWIKRCWYIRKFRKYNSEFSGLDGSGVMV
jgi:hypothetical protein